MVTEKWLIINDQHIPFHDPVCEKLVFGFARKVKPHGVIVLGDLVDFYQLSRFDKDPERANDLQDDIDIAIDYLKKLRKTLPKVKIWYVEGNHEKRLQKDLWSGKQAYASLKCLRMPALLKLNELGVVYFKKKAKIGDMTFIHGIYVRKHSGYSARAHYDKFGSTMMHGHTHRDGKFTIRTLTGHKAVWENYCLCSLNPEYDDFPNWTQGFSLVTFVGKRPYVEQIPILGGKYIYGGKMF